MGCIVQNPVILRLLLRQASISCCRRRPSSNDSSVRITRQTYGALGDVWSRYSRVLRIFDAVHGRAPA